VVVRSYFPLFFLLRQNGKSLCHTRQGTHHENISSNDSIHFIQPHQKMYESSILFSLDQLSFTTTSAHTTVLRAYINNAHFFPKLLHLRIVSSDIQSTLNKITYLLLKLIQLITISLIIPFLQLSPQFLCIINILQTISQIW